MSVTLAIIIILFFLVVIGLNIFQVRYIIRRALKKKILPTLEQNGLVFIKYTWLGFLNSGDFGDLQPTLFISRSGNASISIYIDIYYQTQGANQKATVRIDTLMMFITNVVFSPKFKLSGQ